MILRGAWPWTTLALLAPLSGACARATHAFEPQDEDVGAPPVEDAAPGAPAGREGAVADVAAPPPAPVDAAASSARDELLDAMAFAPDAARRSEVARKLVLAGGGWIELQVFGDDADLLALRGELDRADPLVPDAVFEAARRLAELPTIGELARAMPPTDGFDLELERGAWLCLLGDRAAGLVALGRAERLGLRTRLARESGDPPRAAEVDAAADVHLAQMACGKDRRGAWTDPSLRGRWGALAALGAPGFPLGLLHGAITGSDDSRLDRLEALSLTALVSPTRNPAQIVDLVAPCARGEGSRSDDLRLVFASPATVLAPPAGYEGALIGPADRLEKMATRLEALAASPPRVAPCARTDDPELAADRAQLGPTLRRVAYEAWLVAAAVRARRGGAAQALADAARAERDAAAGQLPFTVPVRLLAGDAPGALAALDAQRDAEAPEDDRFVRVAWRALALDAAGRVDEARDAAIAANALTIERGRLSQPSPGVGSAGRDDPRPAPHVPGIELLAYETLWLRAALVLRARKGAPFLPAETYEPFGGRAPGDVRDAEELLAHALAPESAGAFRKKMCFVTPPEDAPSLPWGPLFVAGAAVVGDVETFLDCVGRRFQGPRRAYFDARARAGRERGDAIAAAAWESRQRRVAALIHDDATALLAYLVGY